ncbi:hypothetical protein KCP70_17910 [Salmonella enterica subsp. enterica]|nr:hypothetical protein KCP70_17910 [Salmonella enterica subsp. enterica]
MAGMKYGHFLKQLARAPARVNVLHPVLMAMLVCDVLHGDSPPFKRDPLDNMTRALQTRINAHFAQRHDYLPLDFCGASTSVFDSTARQFREEISAKLWGKCG